MVSWQQKARHLSLVDTEQVNTHQVDKPQASALCAALLPCSASLTSGNGTVTTTTHASSCPLQQHVQAALERAESAAGEAPTAGSSSGGGGGGSGGSSSSSSGGRVGGSSIAYKAQQLMEQVELLLAQGAPPKVLTAQPPPPPQQQAAQQQQAEQQQAEAPGPWRAAGSASSLFGTGGPPGSGVGGSSGSSGSAGAAAGSGDGGGGPTVTQLMGLFGDSPLFRGGPVPGVQILHQR